MCDEFTLQDDAEAQAVALASALADASADKGLSRREFAAMGAAAAALAGCAVAPGSAEAAGALREAMVSIPTPDGSADAFFVHPAKGRHPAIIIWPDIGGLRDSFKMMARRLAASGYAVLAVNHYYRSAPSPVLASFAEWRTPEGQAKVRPMVALVTPEAVTRDAAAFVTFLDRQRAVNTRRKIGSSGYCMGGPFTVHMAAAVPARVGAAASFHGAGLTTDKPDSPHNLLARTQASYLIAIAKGDDARDPASKDTFRAAAAAAGRPAEIEVYGGDHGWCVPDSPVYHQAEADRAWGRMLALFARL